MQEEELDFELIQSSLKLIDEASMKVNQLGLLVRNLGTKPEFENVKPVSKEQVQLQAKYISDALLDAYTDLADALDAISMHGGLEYAR